MKRAYDWWTLKEKKREQQRLTFADEMVLYESYLFWVEEKVLLSSFGRLFMASIEAEIEKN